MKTSFYIFVGLVFIIVLLSIIHVVVANSLSTTGIDLDIMQSDLTKYKKENVILKEQVLDQSSLYKIASAAAAMGFVAGKKTVFVHDTAPVAKR